ncbi:TIGR02301 family protein [Methylorubrum zatmanii]|uniref:TIGR02301 family protein n=1 Tax=Methylorubrum zatmanii TaxID=29429 RepID=A0ABW1WPT4_9HYPH|nr:TIGR02301 family protein [Methylorubrum zatmanii]MBD8905877.1 TIGR02301 family protein [Methylorubrum zatmanii]
MSARVARLMLGALLAAAPLVALPWAEATAQQRAAAKSAPKPQEKEKDKEPAAPAEPPPAPYDRDLMRLSEIVGALAFLRNLCTAPDAAEWPARMKAILDTEGVTQGRRDRLAGAYNRGFRGYSLTYRVCTPAADEAARRFIAEGERLSHAIAGRFGG